jgi:hypothetical protein
MSANDIEKKFVGQPIFKQLIDFIPKSKFDLFAKKTPNRPILQGISCLDSTCNNDFCGF